MALSCANCLIELGDQHRRASGEFNECGLCKDHRVPDAAFYCSKECAKAHWKGGHKKFHEKRLKDVSSLRSGTSEVVRQEDLVIAQSIQDGGGEELLLPLLLEKYPGYTFKGSSERYFKLIGQAEKAGLQGDTRTAVRFAIKAVEQEPMLADAHLIQLDIERGMAETDHKMHAVG